MSTPDTKGVKLLELAQVAHSLYVSQEPHEQRKLVDVVLSNCRMNGASVEFDVRKPFDLLVDAGKFEILRGGRDSKTKSVDFSSSTLATFGTDSQANSVTCVSLHKVACGHQNTSASSDREIVSRVFEMLGRWLGERDPKS